LKDNAVDSGTVIYVIRRAGKGGSPVRHRHHLVPTETLETHAGMIASDLVEQERQAVQRGDARYSSPLLGAVVALDSRLDD
jgi:hypothetical protein